MIISIKVMSPIILNTKHLFWSFVEINFIVLICSYINIYPYIKYINSIDDSNNII